MGLHESGATVTPNIFVDDQGQEHLTYEYGDVQDGSGRMQQINHFAEVDDDCFYEDEDGQIQHRFMNVGENSQVFENDFIPPMEDGNDILDEVELPETDYQELRNIVGGDEQYEQMLMWAHSNAPPEIQEIFDSVMESSDYPEMQEAIEFMNNAWRQSIDSDNPKDARNNQQPKQPKQEINQTHIDESNEYIVNQVFGGESNFEAAQEFADQVLSPQIIAKYNQAMENATDPNQRVQLAQTLKKGLQGIYRERN